MGHTFECGSGFQLPGHGVQGLRLIGALPGSLIFRNFDVIEMFETNYRLFETDCPRLSQDGTGSECVTAAERRKGYLSLVSSGGAAPIVQTQFAEYGQLVPR